MTLPPWALEAVEGMTFFSWIASIALLFAVLWATGKSISWIVKKFFPGVLELAKSIIAGAQIYTAVKDLPEFIDHSKQEFAKVEQHFTLLDTKVDRIEHEMYPNSGGSLRDRVDASVSVGKEAKDAADAAAQATARNNGRLVRIEQSLGIEGEGTSTH